MSKYERKDNVLKILELNENREFLVSIFSKKCQGLYNILVGTRDVKNVEVQPCKSREEAMDILMEIEGLDFVALDLNKLHGQEFYITLPKIEDYAICVYEELVDGKWQLAITRAALKVKELEGRMLGDEAER